MKRCSICIVWGSVFSAALSTCVANAQPLTFSRPPSTVLVRSTNTADQTSDPSAYRSLILGDQSLPLIEPGLTFNDENTENVLIRFTGYCKAELGPLGVISIRAIVDGQEALPGARPFCEATSNDPNPPLYEIEWIAKVDGRLGFHILQVLVKDDGQGTNAGVHDISATVIGKPYPYPAPASPASP
jgi:hypothetical protein